MLRIDQIRMVKALTQCLRSCSHATSSKQLFIALCYPQIALATPYVTRRHTLRHTYDGERQPNLLHQVWIAQILILCDEGQIRSLIACNTSSTPVTITSMDMLGAARWVACVVA